MTNVTATILARHHPLAADLLQSAMQPEGAQARRVELLGWVFIWVCAAVYLTSMALVLLAVYRTRRAARQQPTAAEAPPVTKPDARTERSLTIAVGSGVGLTVVLLFVLLVGDVTTGRAIQSMANEPDPVAIEVTGHQWWWQVRYIRSPESETFETANEIHVPVGKPVRLTLRSSDVIHSFWVPNLAGKKDMIPGHPTALFLKADRPGTYYGQCAEFCGHQHAKMRLLVVAEPVEQYERWVQAQLQPAAEPTTDAQRRGREVFLGASCVMCHEIQGTVARSHVGPTLTHLAGRQTIAAGSLPNNRGNLGGWILDPHATKPGARMPQNQLTPQQLRDLLDYLESLK